MSFDTDTFLVKEHVGFLKLHEAYDLLTPDGKTLGTAVERASGLVQVLKLLVNKNMLPFKVEIVNAEQQVLVSIDRGFTFFRSKVNVRDASGTNVGYFQQRFLSLGGRFDIYDTQGTQIAELKGDWKGWNFTFSSMSGEKIGMVSRQWGGIAKEMFTSADNYVVNIDRTKIKDAAHLLVMLSAAICIDMVLKENE